MPIDAYPSAVQGDTNRLVNTVSQALQATDFFVYCTLATVPERKPVGIQVHGIMHQPCPGEKLEVKYHTHHRHQALGGASSMWQRTLSTTLRLLSLAFAIITCLSAAAPSNAQECGPQWLPGEGMPGVDGVVWATTMWDPDGPGPQTPKLVVGGQFSIVGNIRANSIAVFDLETNDWSPLGMGMNGAVRSLTTLLNGELVAGGDFTASGDVTMNRVARWNGIDWTPVGMGITGTDKQRAGPVHIAHRRSHSCRALLLCRGCSRQQYRPMGWCIMGTTRIWRDRQFQASCKCSRCLAKRRPDSCR